MPHTQREISLWLSTAPFTQPDDASRTEHFFVNEKDDGLDRITDVTVPTITFRPASGKGPHPCVMICPGGGYSILAWSHEGQDIAAFLNTIGFSAFILKYRCPDRRIAAHADAARAMRLIRAHAAEWEVRPDKVGILGFSAGAHLAATLCAPADPVPYPPADAVDALPYRPDFSVLIYPAYLCDDQFNLAPEFHVTTDTPPCLLVQAENDPIPVENSLGWFTALKRAGVKAEMHIYDDGGHGYGLLRSGFPVSNWPQLASRWLRSQGEIR